MTRLCLSLSFMLLIAVSFAQVKKDTSATKKASSKHTASAPPPLFINFLPHQADTITDTRSAVHGFGIFIRLIGKATRDQIITLHARTYDAPATKPALMVNSTQITIPKSTFSKTGADTIVEIGCSISITPVGSLMEDEKAFIVKEGDEDNPFTVFMQAPAAEEGEEPVADKPNTKDTAGEAAQSKDPTGKPATAKGQKAPKDTTAKPPYTVTLTGADTSLNPMITGDALTRVYTIKLHFKANSQPTKDTLKVPITLLTLTAGQVSPTLLNSNINIYPADWSHQDSSDNITKTVGVTLSSVKSFEHDVSFYLIQGTDQSTHAEVRITTIGLYNPNKPFWVEVGANFDFADGLKPNNFFGGVFLHKRDIRPIFSGLNKGDANQRPKRLGLFAGVFESKTMSDVQTEDFAVLKYYNSRSTLLTRPDSVGAFTDTGKIKRTQVVRNIGLFFSPQIRLTNGSANTDGLHVSASLWLELQWQRISSVVDYSDMHRSDTFFVPARALDTAVKRIPTATEQDIRTHYFGMGLPIYFKEGDANVFFNPVIGFSNQPTYQELSHFTDSSTRCWRGFYAFQFRLNEEHFGIAFTGEVRGLFYPGSKPLVSIALTKKFDLSKFLEFK